MKNKHKQYKNEEVNGTLDECVHIMGLRNNFSPYLLWISDYLHKKCFL